MIEPIIMKCRFCGSAKHPYIQSYVPLVENHADIDNAGMRVCCQECGISSSAALFNTVMVNDRVNTETKHRAIERWNAMQKQIGSGK